MFVSFSNSVGQVFILNWSLITNSFSFFLKLLDELVGDMVFIAAQFLIQFAIVLTQFEFLINLMAALSPWEANGSQEAESFLFSFWTFGSHVIPPHTTHPPTPLSSPLPWRKFLFLPLVATCIYVVSLVKMASLNSLNAMKWSGLGPLNGFNQFVGEIKIRLNTYCILLSWVKPTFFLSLAATSYGAKLLYFFLFMWKTRFYIQTWNIFFKTKVYFLFFYWD